MRLVLIVVAVSTVAFAVPVVPGVKRLQEGSVTDVGDIDSTGDDEPNPGGTTNEVVDLAPARAQRLLHFAMTTIDELAASSGCGEAPPSFACTGVASASENVIGRNDEGLILFFNGCQGGSNVGVSIVEEVASGNIQLSNVITRNLLSECVRRYLATQDASAQTSEGPATSEEQAAVSREQLNPPHEGHADDAGTRMARRQRSDDAERQIERRRRDNPSVHLALTRDPNTKYTRWSEGNAESPPTMFGLGDLTTEADINATLANTISRVHEQQFANSLPPAYDATAGSPCLTDYVARNQASCGSCYAFAASTALALQACIVKHRNGVSAANQPMYTAQGIVSCGSRQMLGNRPYVGGCNGGNMARTFQYIIDQGITTVGCWPYQQTTGSHATHFNPSPNVPAACRTSCYSGSSQTQMLFTSGVPGGRPLSYDSEANIAAAIRSFGALSCSFMVYASFQTGYSGGVYMGRSGPSDRRLGGHAVACYGFGTTSDGTPYWKCINSWGSNWGIAPRGEFLIHRPAGRPASDSGLINACVVAPIDYSDIFPAGAVPPSPPAGFFCVDRTTTSLRLGGRPASCGQLVSVCTGHPLSGLISSECPITCQVAGCSSAPPTWGPTGPDSPSPPPAVSPPPEAPSPPPLTPEFMDSLSGPVCNQYNRMGYCNFVGSQCARTCAGIPTDRYSNCGHYASLPGYCSNPNIRFQPSGLSVAEACPDSCRGRTTQLATETQLHTETRQPAIDVGLYGEEPQVDPPAQADLRGEEAKVEHPAHAESDGLA